jgi:hypothetical protein
MAERRLSGWQIVYLITSLAAIVALAAVALIFGKDAVIMMVLVVVVGMVLVAILNNF